MKELKKVFALYTMSMWSGERNLSTTATYFTFKFGSKVITC